MEFSKQESWSEWTFPSSGDRSDPGNKLRSPTFQADSSPTELPGKLSKGRALLETQTQTKRAIFEDTLIIR